MFSDRGKLDVPEWWNASKRTNRRIYRIAVRIDSVAVRTKRSIRRGEQDQAVAGARELWRLATDGAALCGVRQ